MECRPMPFWFWNARLEKAEIVRQVRQFAEMGLGGFYIHARFGLETAYLSSEWLDMAEAATNEAEKRGLHVWLYDENLFPSGIGNMHVSSRPELRPRFLACAEMEPDDSGVIPLSRLPRGCTVYHVAHIADGVKQQPIAYEITDSAIHFPNPPDRAVHVFWIGTLTDENDQIFGVDYLNPDVLTAFIESTHVIYLCRLGKWFGTAIKGFFTDEPTLLPWHHDISWYKNRTDGLCAPYTPELLSEMKRIAGIETSLPDLAAALFFDRDAGNLRKAYWKTVSRLYEENYFRAYAAWCEKHGLQLTGHVLLEEGMYFNHIFQAGPLQGLRHMHMPGTDQLGAGSEFDSMDYMVEPLAHIPSVRTNVTGPKLVSSIAHAAGKRRVISESFGLGSWKLGFQQMKATVDWLYALGVNRLCPHAFFYSIEGFRKLDAPPSFFHHSGAGLFRVFADYTARLSWALSQGAPMADVALVYPESAFRAAYAVGRQRDADRRISDAYDFMCLALLRSQRAFEIITEESLASARIEGGALLLQPAEKSAIDGVSASVDCLRFQTILIPDASGMDAEACAALQALKEGGGRALALNDLIPKGESWTFEEVSRHVTSFVDPLPRAVELLGAGRERVYVLSRKVEQGTIHYLANTSRDTAFSGHLSLGASCAILLDAEMGEMTAADAAQMPLTLPPSGSLLTFVPDESAGNDRCDARPHEKRIMTPVDPQKWRFCADGDNALPLKDWALHIEASGMQTTYRYAAMVTSEIAIPGAALVLDDISGRGSVMGRSNITVAVNGIECEREGFVHDRAFVKYKVGEIRAGENEIQITITGSAWSGDTRPLTVSPVLMGIFALGKDGHTLTQTVAWTGFCDPVTNGYPYFSGTSRHIAAFDLPRSDHLELRFEKIIGSAELTIDGLSCGVRLWAPWVWKIPSACTGHRAQLELSVTNTLANYLGDPCRFGPEGTVTLAYHP